MCFLCVSLFTIAQNLFQKLTRGLVKSTSKIPSNNGDRISNLPEPIIHHIFSFLETRDVIIASLVSRQWRYLWTSLPYLNFSIDTFSNEKFKDFVNWVLMSQDWSTDIQILQLYCFDFTIYPCINIAARRNVQKLDLQIVTTIDIDCLVTCDSLVELTLCSYSRKCMCEVNLPSSVGFRRLKSLKLQRVELTDEVLARNFISSCPVLENLSMEGCIFCGFKVLVISAKNLKKLKIDYICFLESYWDGFCRSELKVSCPNLVAFNYLGPLPLDVSLQDPSLDNAFISLDDRIGHLFFEGCDSVMCRLLKGLCNTKVIKLSGLFMEFLYHVLAKPDCFSTSFHNLKSLKLSLFLHERQMQSIINLLKWSPNLEALTICIEDVWNSDWKIPDETITCLTYHLKMVVLIHVQGAENELELLRFLLKKGHVLEILNIIWVTNVHNPREIIQKVMKFQRSSSNVALKFLEPKSRFHFFNL